MKLTVTQENLNKALGVVARIAGTKTSLPILSNILLKTDNNRLLLAATNLEVAITEHIGAKVASEGVITIPSRLMSEFIANLPKGNVDLKLEGSKLHINSGHYTSTINGLPADDFPALPEIGEATEIEISAQLMKRAIAQTILTASRDDTRPVLTGVLCHTHEGVLYFAATDGYRLAERKLIPLDSEVSALIPASTLQDVVRVLPEGTETVTILIDNTQVRFRMDDIEITSRLIDGNFPDYRQLIPKSTEINAQTNRDELTRITKIASLFARESGGSITIQTDGTKKTISIHSIASQLGENTSETEADVDQDGTVTLNSRYVIEALGCLDSQDVSFGFSGKLAPCVLKAQDKDPDYQHIIMPLKS